jgi:hypothetical protein
MDEILTRESTARDDGIIKNFCRSLIYHARYWIYNLKKIIKMNRMRLPHRPTKKRLVSSQSGCVTIPFIHKE